MSQPLLLLEYKPNVVDETWFDITTSLWDKSLMGIHHRQCKVMFVQQTKYYTCHEYYLIVLFFNMTTLKTTFSQQVQYRYMLIDKINAIRQEFAETDVYIHHLMMYTFHMPDEISCLIREFWGPPPKMILALVVEMCIPSVSHLYNAFYWQYIMNRGSTPSYLINRSYHPSHSSPLLLPHSG